uniref:Bile salt-activated lipase n=1 Tax=Poecilia formosa TaxID=48698 RepID=A0A087X389_POEFO
VILMSLGTMLQMCTMQFTEQPSALNVVQTKAGAVEGLNVDTGLFPMVEEFKGVPFADVPGKWEKPKPHPGWDGVLIATKFRERCLQVMLLQTKTQGSEDCLYLNIFVPHGLSVSTNLPVMVYLFGGAFLLGASDDVEALGESLYDGKEMADGGVIVVTVNYRVGTLGFLSSGDERLPGNYGLWDQHAAISWVHRNIRAFGGNPDNITIFGQSARAASVNFQMVSPYSKGLFRRAICQGGVALSPCSVINLSHFNLKLYKKITCKTEEDDMLACLKAFNPIKLTMAGKINLLDIFGKDPVMDLLQLAPVVDGDFIPDDPGKLFHNAAQFDYLAGVNSMDGHIFAGINVPSINNMKETTTTDQVKGLLTGLTKDKGDAAVSSAFDVYSVHWGLAPDPAIVKKTVADIETNFLFLVPTQIVLQLHANNTRSACTYSYLFNMKTRIPGFPRWVEAEHAEDLQYLFSKPFSLPLLYFPRHRDAYWTNFAKTGDPSRGNSKVPVLWPAFTKYHQPYLVINDSMSKSSVSYDLRSFYVKFWTQTYGQLPSAGT